MWNRIKDAFKNNILIYELIGWSLLLSALITLGVVVLMFKVEDVSLNEGHVYQFNSGWEMIDEAGNTCSTLDSLPYRGKSDRDETVIIRNTIPVGYSGLTMSFLSMDNSVVVKIDGETIYSFGTHNDLLFGHTSGSLINFVTIPDDSAGAEITIEFTSAYDNCAANIESISVGSKDALIIALLQSQTSSFALVVICLALGLIFTLLTIMRRVAHEQHKGMHFLGIFIWILNLAMLTETKALPIFLGNTVLYSVQMFLIVLIAPIFLLLYYQKRFEDAPDVLFKGMLIALFINAITQFVFQGANILDFMDMSVVAGLMAIASYVVIIVKLILIWRSRQENVTALDFVAIFVLGASIITDMWRTAQFNVGDRCLFTRWGVTIFGIICAYQHLRMIISDNNIILEENSKLLRQSLEFERRQLQTTIDEREKEKAANEAKSMFLANMSHEIRTPINAIIGLNTIIRRETESVQIKEYADNVDASAHNLLALVNDILDFSKIESGGMDITPGEYSFSSMVNDIYIMIKTRAQQKHLKFILKNDPDIPDRLIGDEMRVRQIIINLLTNAVKYTESGSVTIEFTQEKGEGSSDRYRTIRVTVTDTGIGIKKDNYEKIFNSFERVDSDRNKNIEGTGLGLNITRRLARAMGGDIIVDSVYGEGSVFTADIPQEAVGEETVGNLSQRYVAASASKEAITQIYRSKLFAPEARILVVDDVEMNLKVFVGLLKNSGMQIDKATSGKEALSLMEQYHYHIIFLDDMMPVMSGRETLAQMQVDILQNEEYPNADTPVVMVTANVQLGAKEEYLNLGFAAYLSKPVHAENLEMIIGEFLPEGMDHGDGNFETLAPTFLGNEMAIAGEYENAGDKGAAAQGKTDTSDRDNAAHGIHNKSGETEHKTLISRIFGWFGTEMGGRVCRYSLSAFAITLILFVIYSSLTSYQGYSFSRSTIITMDSGWTVEYDGATYEDVSVPETYSGKSDTVTLSGTMPAIRGTKTLVFKISQQEAEVQIGDDTYEYFAFNTSNPMDIGYPPEMYVLMQVDSTMSGQPITITYHNIVSTNNTIGSIFVGDTYDVVVHLIKKHIFSFIAFIVLLVTGLSFMARFIFTGRNMEKNLGLLYNASLVLVCAMWMICQIDIRQVFFDNIPLVRNMGFFAVFMIGPVFLFATNELTKHHYAVYCNLVAFLQVITTFIIAVVCWFSNGQIHLRECLPVAFAFVLISIASGGYMLIDLRNKSRKLYAKMQTVIVISIISYAMGAMEVLRALLFAGAGQGVFFSFSALIYALASFVAQDREFKDTSVTERMTEMKEKAKSELLTQITVEIRGPLNTLLGMDERILNEEEDVLILSYAGAIRTEGMKIMTIINEVLERAHSLNSPEIGVDSLMQISKMDESGISPEAMAVNLGHIQASPQTGDQDGISEAVANIPQTQPEVKEDEGFGRNPQLIVGLISGVKGINIQNGLSYCMDDDEFYIETVNDYLSSERLASIQDAYLKKDWETFRRETHSLKSTSYSIGADAVGDMAKAMENAAADENMDYINANYGPLMDEAEILEEALHKALKMGENK